MKIAEARQTKLRLLYRLMNVGAKPWGSGQSDMAISREVVRPIYAHVQGQTHGSAPIDRSKVYLIKTSFLVCTNLSEPSASIR